MSRQSYVEIGVSGIDELFVQGVPRKSVNLIVGSPGSGKSILGLQTLKHAVMERDESCLYLSLEESTEQLRYHVQDFGWDDVLDDRIHIEEYDPFEVAGAVETWYEKQQDTSMSSPFGQGSVPQVFRRMRELEPDRVVVDSLSAIEAGFAERDRFYRMYVNQFFRFFRDMGAEAFVIVESQEIPDRITETGEAEFLADGIILMHRQNRSRGVEVYKMRGSGFKEKIAPMEIREDDGIVVHPDESFFEQVEGDNFL